MYSLQKCKTINNHGLINLPKKWRVELGFDCGELVEIRMRRRQIWICHCQNDTTENQRYISPYGTITIPAEFRRLLDISDKTELCLYVEPEKNAFVIMPD
ncbi:AbrB/MazE/SpoVT family DNA-binding domain-containing protein [Oceanobacillus damuensis]|uniref:AbrB/MazE/SpoVT family DNA-binding domain-containing protein n=1 Tax=Oceanobacillus damuensis TaxID=937928 RepID=UPI0008302E49|nr:AbrB/MazE/SpoVT family DNA-binding domain-containing protein [Oceanobacillus damuensis]